MSVAVPVARPGHVGLPDGRAVLKHLGWALDAVLWAQADQHALQVATFARAYTRGAGFATDSETSEALCRQDIAAVIVTASARSLSNPSSAREIEAGSFKEAPGSFYGWSLAETFVLNRYRRRAG